VKSESETVRTDHRVPDEIRERVPDRGASDWKSPTAESAELLTAIIAEGEGRICMTEWKESMIGLLRAGRHRCIHCL